MFIYRPHLHASDDVVTTPDLIVESWRDSAAANPLALLASASETDLAGLAVTAAFVLVAGSYGPLATIGLAVRADATPGSTVRLGLIARQAWRFADIAAHLARIELGLASPRGSAQRAALSPPAALPRRGEMIFLPAASPLAAPATAGWFAITLTDPVIGRALEYRILAR